jgi:transposase InsO family protein
VPPAAVQQSCRALFERWGLPDRIRIDNGAPWANWSDLPPALALWWIGLGIEPIYNHAHRPTENAKVERCNGLVVAWGEPEQCADMQAFTDRLSWMAAVQRERYPAAQGQTRQQVWPTLGVKRRAYQADKEAEQWDIGRVRAWLALGQWPRYVSKIGQITLYGKAYRAHRNLARQQVWVRLDPHPNEWVVSRADGQVIIRHRAEQITAERICALNVAHPRPPSNKRKRQNSVAQEVA